MKYGKTTLEAMLDDPLDNNLSLKDPQLVPPMAPKGPHLAINWPLGALTSLGPTSWLVFSENGSNTLECMLSNPFDTILGPEGPYLGPLIAPKSPHLAKNRPCEGPN